MRFEKLGFCLGIAIIEKIQENRQGRQEITLASRWEGFSGTCACHISVKLNFQINLSLFFRGLSVTMQ